MHSFFVKFGFIWRIEFETTGIQRMRLLRYFVHHVASVLNGTVTINWEMGHNNNQ